MVTTVSQGWGYRAKPNSGSLPLTELESSAGSQTQRAHQCKWAQRLLSENKSQKSQVEESLILQEER